MKALKNKRGKVFLCTLCMLLAICMSMTSCMKMAPVVSDTENNEDESTNLNRNENNSGNVDEVGVNNPIKEDVEAGNEVVIDQDSENEGECPLPPFYYGTYISDKTTFGIDNVTLTFVWGDHYPCGVEYELRRRSYPQYDIYFENAFGDTIHIKHVEEELLSEKYSCEVTYKNGKTKIKFNHSEELTIPAEAFLGESGLVYFEVRTISSANQVEYTFCLIKIYYKVVGDQVILEEPQIDYEVEYED